MSPPAEASFSVDVAGLLEALTEQFPEPLLCVRELVQNAADAGARSIEVDVAYDAPRGLARLSVVDDGRGMGAAEVDGYLVIGRSEKDPSRHRGRFGVGKLSPYALGFTRMIVETSNGAESHRLEFRPDGSGHIERGPPEPRGTSVRVYKLCGREEAERLADRAFEIARSSCGSIGIPLRVNGVSVNHAPVLPTPYAIRFELDGGHGTLGIAAEPVRTLMAGGIVLESGAPILGPEVSYILDAPRLSPTLSRNAVRRDRAFDELLRATQAQLRHLVAAAAQILRQRVERLRQGGALVERALEPDDRAALEWLRARLLDPDGEPPPLVQDAPVLETADGDLVSASALVEVLRRERRVPISRVPRTREEVAGHADRGVPVLLLYRDLEDFLERQQIETVEVDGLDDGAEIAEAEWGRGEHALALRPRLLRRDRGSRVPALAAVLLLSALGGAAFARIAARAEVDMGSPPGVKAADPGEGRLDRPRSSPTVDRALVAAGFAGAAAGLVAFGAARGLRTLVDRRRSRARAWLLEQAGVPFARSRSRGLALLGRVVLHPVDFVVARGWTRRGGQAAAGGRAIAGYRAFAPEPPIRAGARLDLDRLELGFVDLVSAHGDPSDARILIRRRGRILLNRNHPTIRNLTCIAATDPARAQVLLEALLATDPDLSKGCAPRQVEWDLVGRAPRVLALRSPR